jgi:hypothetical protein
LFGRGGDDYLDGGPSVADWIDGGEGTDTCVDPDGFIVLEGCEAREGRKAEAPRAVPGGFR